MSDSENKEAAGEEAKEGEEEEDEPVPPGWALELRLAENDAESSGVV